MPASQDYYGEQRDVCGIAVKSIVLHKCNILLFCSLSMVYFRVDTTRIEYSIPLRENWALPYFACQVAALTGYLKSNLNAYGEVRNNFFYHKLGFVFINHTINCRGRFKFIFHNSDVLHTWNIILKLIILS